MLNMPKWMENAIFYEIYPQSFYDSNKDGIGDLQGIIQKLDYVKELGCNAIWLNPIFDSPFMDAGYDVRDYKQVAARYGTNEDAEQLFEEAHKKGIHVILDLVAGHTSDEHAWFVASKEVEENAFSHRYVWTNGAFVGIAGRPYMSGMSDRDGAYMLNFFATQPALNYGWLRKGEPWMSAVDSEEAIATKEAMKDIIRFWLNMGADGFRCDMADSLVKEDDENKSATAAIWKEIRKMLDDEYPEAVLISEWSNPKQAVVGGGFHADFYLNHWGNGYHTLLRDYENHDVDNSFFKGSKDADICRFLDDYLPKYEIVKDIGYISMFTCNHDTPRPSRTLTDMELKLYFGFLLTMPGIPFVYYGDEIGMRYIENMRSKEGGYQRTGSRTPMQWNRSENAGFSDADAKDLYLPVDASKDAPSVLLSEQKADSILHTVKELTAIRLQTPDLQSSANLSVLHAKAREPFVYRRGHFVMLLNPYKSEFDFTHECLWNARIMYQMNSAELKKDTVKLGAESFSILQID